MITQIMQTPRLGAELGVHPLWRRPAVVAAASCLAVLLVLLVGLVAAAPARAATGDFEFVGRGYGHGVGMSQWGAWAAARDGKDFRWITGFYYPTATLDPLADPAMELKVKLSSDPSGSLSSLTQNFTQVDVYPGDAPITLVTTGGVGSSTEQVSLGSLANLQVGQNGVYIVTNVRRGPYASVEVRPGAGGRIKVQFWLSSNRADALPVREYWGKMLVEPSSTVGFLRTYNIVPIEKYLRSIAEVIPNWAQSSSTSYAPEAVKAQAVAARTYAVANVTKNGVPVPNAFLNDNQSNQVYRGYTYEALNPGIGEAAEQTQDPPSSGRGLILKFNGNPISSFYSSNSGGYTSTPASVWNSLATYPYLPAKPDPYSLAAPTSNPGYAWTFSISPADLFAAVDGMSDTGGNAVHIGMLDRVEVASRDTSDPGSHVATFRLVGVDGSAVVSASSLRGRLGSSRMRSTLVVRITNPRVFSDVPSGHFFLTEIERIALAGIVQGFPDGKFSPDASVARWQFAKMVVGLHNVLLADDQIAVVDVGTSPFADVPAQPGVLGDESDWVAAAKNAGLVKGFTETVFMPYASVQRDQMATMLVRAMRWEDEAAALPSDTPGFADVAPGSTHWADTRYLKSLGVLRGYEEPPGSGTFVLRWADPTLRMHAAAVLCRVLDLPAG